MRVHEAWTGNNPPAARAHDLVGAAQGGAGDAAVAVAQQAWRGRASARRKGHKKMGEGWQGGPQLVPALHQTLWPNTPLKCGGGRQAADSPRATHGTMGAGRRRRGGAAGAPQSVASPSIFRSSSGWNVGTLTATPPPPSGAPVGAAPEGGEGGRVSASHGMLGCARPLQFAGRAIAAGAMQ